MKFDKDFLWGAATASYQIEGAYNEDGRTPSVWDVYSHTPGKVKKGETGDVACDHYHRLEEDVKMMKEMGLMAYRFSVSWDRLFPNGEADPNPAGFAFYDKLVNLLLENGILPVMTVFHWDLPSALLEKGGFEWEGISDVFADYAGKVVEHFSDRVKMFLTINEPQCVVHLGYVTGAHAPGEKRPQEETGHIMRNLLLSHGKAVTAMRKAAKGEIQIGTATTGTLCSPLMETPETMEKAYELSFPGKGEGLGFSHNWFLDPVILRENHIPYLTLSEEDMEQIAVPVDFLGINVYNGMQCDEKGYVDRYQGFPRTGLGWPVTPNVMNYGMRFLYRRYRKPIYISENGVACNDRIFLDGKVHDADRIDFIQSYLEQLHTAVENGCDVRGYFHWSLMDNFEWNEGYDPRFGLIFVDYRNGNRIWKDSALWYKEWIEKNKHGKDCL